MSEYITITDQGIKLPNEPPLELVSGNDPILKEIMPPFSFSYDDPIWVANKLIEVLINLNEIGRTGLGLSANQIGLRKRCFVAGVADNLVGYFNPVILETGKDTELIEEGCLSYPDLYIKIERPKMITLSYQDYEGEEHIKWFDGMTARVLQHEVDYLNGITFQNRAGPMALQIAKRKMHKRLTKKN